MSENIITVMTAIMREADKTFETVGGSTRHYVRDVLLPLMEKKGLKIIKQGEAQAGAGWVKGDYDRLYDQVKGGRRKVCYVDYYWDRDTSKEPCRDITTIRADYMQFSARGISYGGPWDMDKEESDIKKEFIAECERLNVEWLDEGLVAGREEELWEAFENELYEIYRREGLANAASKAHSQVYLLKVKFKQKEK